MTGYPVMFTINMTSLDVSLMTNIALCVYTPKAINH